jgi:hypothetical protein
MVIGILIGATVEGVSYVKRRRALKKLETSNDASRPRPAPRNSPPQTNGIAVHREPEHDEDIIAPPPYESTRNGGDVVILEGLHTSCVEGVEGDEEVMEEGMPPEYERVEMGDERQEGEVRRPVEVERVEVKRGIRVG